MGTDLGADHRRADQADRPGVHRAATRGHAASPESVSRPTPATASPSSG
jgi:hypothetical protein